MRYLLMTIAATFLMFAVRVVQVVLHCQPIQQPYVEAVDRHLLAGDTNGNWKWWHLEREHQGPGIGPDGFPSDDVVVERWVPSEEAPKYSEVSAEEPKKHSTFNFGELLDQAKEEAEQKREPKPDRLTEPLLRKNLEPAPQQEPDPEERREFRPSGPTYLVRSFSGK